MIYGGTEYRTCQCHLFAWPQAQKHPQLAVGGRNVAVDVSAKRIRLWFAVAFKAPLKSDHIGSPLVEQFRDSIELSHQ